LIYAGVGLVVEIVPVILVPDQSVQILAGARWISPSALVQVFEIPADRIGVPLVIIPTAIPDGPVRVKMTPSEEEIPMPGFSVEFANRLLDYAFRGVEPVDNPGVETSLHHADPGTVGDNEIAGMSYDRQPSTFNPADGAAITLALPVPFENLPPGWILYIGAFTLTGEFVGSMPNGQLRQFNAALNDVFTSPLHGFLNDMPVALLGILNQPFPGGVDTDTPYYVRDVTTDTFKLTLAPGGAPIDVTAIGAGTARRVHHLDPGENFTVLAGSQFSFVGI
jgi:hypothetical protein